MTAAVRVKVKPASDADAQLWRLTREVANLLDALPWVLVGGQMVAILEAEQEATIAVGLRIEDLTGPRFTRLARLSQLNDEGVLDDDMRWPALAGATRSTSQGSAHGGAESLSVS